MFFLHQELLASILKMHVMLSVRRIAVRLNGSIGAIGALMNRVHRPRTLVVFGLNAGMGTAAEARRASLDPDT